MAQATVGSDNTQPCTIYLLPLDPYLTPRDFETQVADGRLLAGHNDVYMGNQPLAYGSDPAENVVFIGCHDNETIFDNVRGSRALQAGVWERFSSTAVWHICLFQPLPS